MMRGISVCYPHLSNLEMALLFTVSDDDSFRVFQEARDMGETVDGVGLLMCAFAAAGIATE